MALLCDLHSRELGGFSYHTKDKWRENFVKISRKILKKVVLSQSRHFKKVPTITSNGQVFYDDGKLFLGHKGTNTIDCHAIRDGGRGHDNLSQVLRQLYSFPLKPNIKDQVIFQNRHSMSIWKNKKTLNCRRFGVALSTTKEVVPA